jgi:hypothetical protein
VSELNFKEGRARWIGHTNQPFGRWALHTPEQRRAYQALKMRESRARHAKRGRGAPRKPPKKIIAKAMRAWSAMLPPGVEP